MIKLDITKMQRAIQRAKALRPKVRMIGERLYEVIGSKGDTYKVGFAIVKDAQGNRVKLGECNCLAGQNEMTCYHLVAAAAVNIGIHAMRQAVAA